jgi:hypothetical protein
VHCPAAVKYVIPTHIQDEMDETEVLTDQFGDNYLGGGAEEGWEIILRSERSSLRVGEPFVVLSVS